MLFSFLAQNIHFPFLVCQASRCVIVSQGVSEAFETFCVFETYGNDTETIKPAFKQAGCF